MYHIDSLSQNESGNVRIENQFEYPVFDKDYYFVSVCCNFHDEFEHLNRIEANVGQLIPISLLQQREWERREKDRNNT